MCIVCTYDNDIDIVLFVASFGVNKLRRFFSLSVYVRGAVRLAGEIDLERFMSIYLFHHSSIYLRSLLYLLECNNTSPVTVF